MTFFLIRMKQLFAESCVTLVHTVCHLLLITFSCCSSPRIVRAELSRGKLPAPKVHMKLIEVLVSIYALKSKHRHGVSPFDLGNSHVRSCSLAVFHYVCVRVLSGGRWHPGLYQHGAHLHIQPLGHPAGRGLQRWPHRHLGLSHARHRQNHQCTHSPGVLFMVRHIVTHQQWKIIVNLSFVSLLYYHLLL